MKINLEALEALDAVDRHGTFATAAESLNKVPSSISYSISRLEEELKVTLFDRSGKRARLTRTGKAVLEDGRRLLRSAIELERRAQSIEIGWEGEIRIAIDATLPFRVLVPYITDFFHESHPTRLSFTHEVLGGTWDALLNGRADMVIGAIGDPPNVSGFTAFPIGQVHTVLAVAPDHPLAGAQAPLSRSAIAQHRIVELHDTARDLPPLDLGAIQGQDRIVVPTFQAKLEAQLAGLGIGFLPRRVVAHFEAHGKLKAVEVEEPRPAKRYYAAWNTGDAGNAVKWWANRLRGTDFSTDELVAHV